MCRQGRLTCVLLLACSAAGCGYTPRDQFLYNRQEVARAKPGDGSQIASRWEPRRGTATATVPSSVAATNPR
jgi:hypothetical protein